MESICYNQLQKYLRHGTVFWHKWPVHDLVLVIPLHPLSKLLAIQDHTQNLEEQLWMGGRREVSVIFYRPVTRSDLKQERSFFRGSVSSYLQLVVVLLSFEEKTQMTLAHAHNRDNCHFNNYYTHNTVQQGKRDEPRQDAPVMLSASSFHFARERPPTPPTQNSQEIMSRLLILEVFKLIILSFV